MIYPMLGGGASWDAERGEDGMEKSAGGQDGMTDDDIDVMMMVWWR